MIHNRTHQVFPETCDENPFYLFVTNEQCKKLPLPLAIKANNREALQWRNKWETCNSRAVKAFCLYHPIHRNWVGGFEDGVNTVQECKELWESPNEQ